MAAACSVLVAIERWDVRPWLAAFQAAMPHLHFTTDANSEAARAARYAIAWRPRPGIFQHSPHLQAIFSLGAGVDHMIEDATLPAVPVARVVDPSLTLQMSEWVALQVLLHHRRFTLYDGQQKAREWRDHRDQAIASEVTIGLMGLGVMGLDAARVLGALGFNLCGWSRTAKNALPFPTFSGTEGLDAFLERCDMLVCLLPLTPRTHGLIDRRVLSQLRRSERGPFFINAGRGPIHVEADVIACLREVILRGASLDVFEEEPLAASSPLWDSKGVFITPHNAAVSRPDAIAQLIARQIAHADSGQPLQHLIDRALGY